MDLVRENIEFEQLFTEAYADTVVREEYLVPDTLPDVHEVLMLDAKPRILNYDIQDNKILLSGKIDYTVLYLSKVNDVSEVQSLNYSTTFSNVLEHRGEGLDIQCDSQCFIEHMECNMVNERKICIAGILKCKGDIYTRHNYEIVKDIDNVVDTQFARKPMKLDKIIHNMVTELMGEAQLLVAMEKPQIGKVLKLDINLNKKDLKLFEGKLKIEVNGNIKLVYEPVGERDIFVLEETIALEKEIDMDDVNPTLESYLDVELYDTNYVLRDDDLGEKRIVDIAVSAKAITKLMQKEELDMIEDVYSPSVILTMDKKELPLNIMHKQVSEEKVHKFDIEFSGEDLRPKEIISVIGNVVVDSCRVLEDGLTVEGALKVEVLYKTIDEERFVDSVSEEVPFTFDINMPGAKIDMQAICKCYLEDLEADVQAGNITIKALIKVYCRCDYKVNRDFVIDINVVEGEIPTKKASIIIYVIQNGDTLWKIAKKYQTTVDALVKINDIIDPDKLVPGNKLIIPGRAII